MLIQFYIPETLSHDDLDRYLARGWFRNSILLHNSKVICMNRDVYSILNIRLNLATHTPNKRLRKLMRKGESQFETRIRPVHIQAEKEALYRQHLPRFKGFLFESLEQFLHAHTRDSVFDTYEVSVYDGQRLIAFSLFDLGDTSMASLLAVFDPDYAKFSPGVFTMLVEVQEAKRRGLQHYYPGYVLDGSNEFDYKLRLGPMEYLNDRGQWVAWEALDREHLPGRLLKQRFAEAADFLRDRAISFEQKFNPFYTLGYIEPFRGQFPRSTLVLFLPDPVGRYIILEYVFEEKVYQLAELEYDPSYEYLVDMQLTPELKDASVYITQLLKYKKVLRKTDSLHDLAPDLQTFVSNEKRD